MNDIISRGGQMGGITKKQHVIISVMVNPLVGDSWLTLTEKQKGKVNLKVKAETEHKYNTNMFFTSKFSPPPTSFMSATWTPIK